MATDRNILTNAHILKCSFYNLTTYSKNYKPPPLLYVFVLWQACDLTGCLSQIVEQSLQFWYTCICHVPVVQQYLCYTPYRK